jgi:hypothetical protein
MRCTFKSADECKERWACFRSVQVCVERAKRIGRCCIAVLVAIPKKGDLSVCDNWRGISLLDVFGKMFARIIVYHVKRCGKPWRSTAIHLAWSWQADQVLSCMTECTEDLWELRILEGEINVTNGLRQGCAMALILFNLFFNLVMEMWRNCCSDKATQIKYRVSHPI